MHTKSNNIALSALGDSSLAAQELQADTGVGRRASPQWVMPLAEPKANRLK